ncbi:hypothetical protein HYDPIDRAFT_149035 [Hydnomerulius pinastri MD-312]|nr:hypothetical protein HYDPIDRAFT_149035 [Hydnomerulius pinastri MD-312]
MVSIQPLTLLGSSSAKWTVNQEKTINREYPFIDLHLESPDQFVVRTYLQFLWLPESIMPLHLLVPSLERVQDVPSRRQELPHPLHALLDPLLLSTRTSAAKYHVELPQILADNGGAGEAEESMMWFALNHEKMGNTGEEADLVNSEDAVMLEEKSRNTWFERLERREVQIQILLYCLKLSLPGPCTPLPPVTISPSTNDAVPSTKKKRRKERPKTIIPSPDERLESFMDKLSMWQLVSLMDDGRKRNNKLTVERDWMQVFCEDVVERQFKSTLPDACALLRSKLFPHSPFADEGNDTDLSGSSSSPLSRRAKSARSTASKTKVTQRSGSVISQTTTSDSRARSRSLSVSLAQDASARRSSSNTSTSLKRALSREVSMSRAFKPRLQTAPSLKEVEGSKAAQVEPADTKPSTTSKTRKSASGVQGVTLVAATPTKPKTKGESWRYAASEARSSSPSLGLSADVDSEESDESDGVPDMKEEEDEMWLPSSSPDILLLGARKRSTSGSSSSLGLSDDLDGDDGGGIDTPVKKRMRV